MSNIDIESFCREHNLNYRGMYMNDQLNNIQGGDGCYLINLDDSVGEGTHWTGVFIHGDLQLYYDPLGLFPEDELLEKFPNLVVSDVQNQLETSVLCGYYVCIFFLVMSCNPTMDAYERLTHSFFTSDTENNNMLMRGMLQ